MRFKRGPQPKRCKQAAGGERNRIAAPVEFGVAPNLFRQRVNHRHAMARLGQGQRQQGPGQTTADDQDIVAARHAGQYGCGLGIVHALRRRYRRGKAQGEHHV